MRAHRHERMFFCSSLWLPVPAAHRDSVFAESLLYRPLVGVHAFGDLGCGPAVFVESGSLVDLVGSQAGSAHGHVVYRRRVRLTVLRSIPNWSPSSYTVAPAW